MLINIIDVGTPNTHAAKNGRSYQSLEVTYKDEQAQTKTKKLMSFSNPSVFNHIKNLTKGDQVNVSTTKDDAGYWQWTGINADNTASPSPTPATTSSTQGTRVTGSNYETKEERAQRQVLIVRQSSLSVAASALAVGSKSAPTADAIIQLAKQFEDYVFGKEEKAAIPELTDLNDDIPY